jgi:hypothetical protein
MSSMTLEQLMDVVGNRVRQEMQARAVTASLAPTPVPNVPAATSLAPSQPPSLQPTSAVPNMHSYTDRQGLATGAGWGGGGGVATAKLCGQHLLGTEHKV